MTKQEFDTWVEDKFDGRFIKMSTKKAIGQVIKTEFTPYKVVCITESEVEVSDVGDFIIEWPATDILRF